MNNNASDDTLALMIDFNSINDKMNKLKEWKLLSPKSKEFRSIYYKNNFETYDCEVIGYLSKDTNPKCFDCTYETIVIKANENIIKIASAFLLEMQKKDFSFSYKQTD